MNRIEHPIVTEGGADLHAHTVASDGRRTAEDLVLHAIEKKLRVLSITNHNVMDPDTARLQEKYNSDSFRLINGIELGAKHILKNGKIVDVHVKGHLFNPCHPAFLALVSRYRKERENYLKEILRKLEAFQIFITYEELLESCPETLMPGRVHISNLAVKKGHAANVDEFMDKYIGKMGQRLCYVDAAEFMNIPTMQEVVETILLAGGMPDLAHPFYCVNLNTTELLELVEDYKSYAGYAGCMEVYYRDYTPEQTTLLECIAEIFDLIPSCGSDYHGFYGNEDLMSFNEKIYLQIEQRHQEIHG